MKLKKLFARAVEIGIDADPRGRKMIEKMLKKEAARSKKLEGNEKVKYIVAQESDEELF